MTRRRDTDVEDRSTGSMINFGGNPAASEPAPKSHPSGDFLGKQTPTLTSPGSSSSALSSSLPSISAPGFLGSTSYGAFMSESQGSLGVDALDGERVEKKIEFPGLKALLLTGDVSGGLQLGVRIVRSLPEKSLCDLLMQRYSETQYCIIIPDPLFQYCYQSVWSTYERHLTQPRKLELLTAMAREINDNGQESLECSIQDTIRTWAQSFTGHRLRWEVMGLIFTRLGMAAVGFPDRKKSTSTKIEPKIDWNKFTGQMVECAEACLLLCDNVDAVNDLVVSVMYQLTILESIHEGDSSEYLTEYQSILNISTSRVHLEVTASILTCQSSLPYPSNILFI